MLKKLKTICIFVVFILQWIFNFYILDELHKVSDYKPTYVYNKIGNQKPIENVNNNLNSVEKVSNRYDKVIKNDINKTNYLAVIKIDKIGLITYLYDKNSYMNNVDKGVEILKTSDMPDRDRGNLILAAHSGSSSIAYFHRLNEVTFGDVVRIDYNNKTYEYKISKIYDIEKTGKLIIDRDYDKSTLTMITCKGDDKQLVVIGYMI